MKTWRTVWSMFNWSAYSAFGSRVPPFPRRSRANSIERIPVDLPSTKRGIEGRFFGRGVSTADSRIGRKREQSGARETLTNENQEGLASAESRPKERLGVVNKSGSDLTRKLSRSLFTCFINIHRDAAKRRKKDRRRARGHGKNGGSAEERWNEGRAGSTEEVTRNRE